MIVSPARVTRPALMILTSHRKDCFELCIWCLERFTDLSRFAAIYVLANAVSAPHKASIAAFASHHAHARLVPCLPKGLLPAVMEAQNAILEQHRDDGVVKLDEDVFVTPHWLDHLLGAHQAHVDDPSVLLVGCPTPVSATGKRCLGSFFQAHFPEILSQTKGRQVDKDPLYHRLVWEAVLTRGFMEHYALFPSAPYYYVPTYIIQCLLYDRRAIEAIGPFPTQSLGGQPVTDEIAVNLALRRTGCKAALPSAGLVHHYSHAGCLSAMLEHVPVAAIKAWFESSTEVAGSSTTTPV